MRPTFIVAASVAALSILSGAAFGQANRTFVSGHGSDSNPCSLAAPCRSFAGALNQTNPGGEITILDPAGYGSVTINKSVSIVNDGVGEAGVTTATAIDGIDISVGAGDVVNLRGLTLVGGGVGVVGLKFTGTGTLNVQNCVIRGFTNDGFTLLPAGTAQFNISDTIVSNVGNDAVDMASLGGAVTVTAVFNRVQAIGAASTGILIDGLGSTGTFDVTIANSTASNNQLGIYALSAANMANVQVMVVNSVMANNNLGIDANGTNSTTYLAKNTIAGNVTAFQVVNSGTLFSFGDNDVKSNGADGGAIPLVFTK